MAQRNFFLSVSLIFAISASGCVGINGNRQDDSLSRQVARHDQQIQKILSQVGQVEQVMPGQAEMWSQVQNLRQEMNTIHGQVDDMNNQFSGSSSGDLASLRERTTRLESLVRQIASQLGINADGVITPTPSSSSPIVSSPAVPTPTIGTPVTVKNTGTSDTAVNLYNSGTKFFEKRQYKEAIAIFKEFNSNYPGHSLASNAAFWEGESYYQMKDYTRAALAYSVVIDKYPNSNKMQSAMLKQGMAFNSIGKKEAGKARLQDLVSRYPSSPEASRAKTILKAK